MRIVRKYTIRIFLRISYFVCGFHYSILFFYLIFYYLIIFSSYALFSLLCDRCNDLCGCRGVDSGNRGRRALQLGSTALCRRIYRHDGTGCGVGVAIFLALRKQNQRIEQAFIFHKFIKRAKFD